MKIFNADIHFWSKFSFLFSALLCLAYLIVVVAQVEEITTRKFDKILLAVAPMTFLCIVIVFFLCVNSKKIALTNFYLKLISISITLLIFSLSYPFIPSITTKENLAYSQLKTELIERHEFASHLVKREAYQDLNQFFIGGGQTKGAMNFRLGGNGAIQSNMSYVESGEYTSMDLMHQLNIGDRNDYFNQEKEKEITKKLTSVEDGNIPYDLNDTNYVYKDIYPTYFSEDANKLLFEYKITAVDINKCFNVSAEIFFKDNTTDKMLEKQCTDNRNANFLYMQRYLNKHREYEKIRFMIAPIEYNLDSAKNWRIGGAELRVNNTGRNKEATSVCLEGFLEGEPRKIFHVYSKGRIANGPCPYINQ